MIIYKNNIILCFVPFFRFSCRLFAPAHIFGCPSFILLFVAIIRRFYFSATNVLNS